MNNTEINNGLDGKILINIQRLIEDLPIEKIHIYENEIGEILHLTNYDKSLTSEVITAYYESIILEENYVTSTVTLSYYNGSYLLSIYFEKED